MYCGGVLTFPYIRYLAPLHENPEMIFQPFIVSQKKIKGEDSDLWPRDD